MNATLFRTLGARPWLMIALSALLASVAPLPAASLASFGYGTMRDANHVASSRPLVVVLVHFNDSPMTGDSNFFHHLVFDLAHPPRNVQGAFREMSNGRFSWTRAGVVTLEVPANERVDSMVSRAGDRNLGVLLYHSNLVHRTMVSGQVDFSAYADNNGHITHENLAIVFLCNGEGGAVRQSGPVKPPGFTCDFNGSVATAGQGAFVQFISHELLHLLGCLDLYPPGCWNANLSMMSCESYDPTNYYIWHLDPWHKMQLGWSEPRLRSLPAGGVASLPAAQQMDATAPLLLYDPSAGAREFWLVEYRTTNSPSGPGYDLNCPGAGMALWHVRHTAEKMPLLLVDFMFPNAQPNWRRCRACGGLVIEGAEYSSCPATEPHWWDHLREPHDLESPGHNYCLPVNDPGAPGQPNWRYCYRCSGLFYCSSADLRDGICPANGTHDATKSGNYTLVHDDPRAFGLNTWRYCLNCKSLFCGEDSHCPVGGAHDGSTSGDYCLPLREGWTMHTEAAPDLSRARSPLWEASALTPPLSWLNGAITTTRLQVHPFTPGAGRITVEWLNEVDTWVDFNWTGTVELGTFASPFNTFAEGASGVPHGGTLHVKAGHGKASVRMDKRVRIESYGGTARVGR